jgi:hypothetical protein
MLINKKLGFGARAIARPAPPTLSQRIDALSRQSPLDPKLEAVRAAIVAADGNANLTQIAATLAPLQHLTPGLALLEKLLPDLLHASRERNQQLDRIADALCHFDDAVKDLARLRHWIEKGAGGRGAAAKPAPTAARKKP